MRIEKRKVDAIVNVLRDAEIIIRDMNIVRKAAYDANEAEMLGLNARAAFLTSRFRRAAELYDLGTDEDRAALREIEEDFRHA